jgi:DNA-binding transcriptional LysR family regulator
MVPKLLVLDDLRSGRLVAPLDFVAGPFKIVLWIAPHLRARSETRALVDWLTKQFRKSGMQGETIEPTSGTRLRAVSTQ